MLKCGGGIIGLITTMESVPFLPRNSRSNGCTVLMCVQKALRVEYALCIKVRPQIALEGLIFVPIFLLRGQFLWDDEASDKVAPAETVSDDEGDRPMSEATSASPSVPTAEVAPVKPDTHAEGASSVPSVTAVAPVVVPPPISAPIASLLPSVVLSEAPSSDTPSMASPAARQNGINAPLGRVLVVRTSVTAIPELNAISVILVSLV